MHMKRKVMMLAVGGAGIAFLTWWFVFRTNESPEEKPQTMSAPAMQAMGKAAERRSEAKLPGAEILKNYAENSTRPEDDLQAMAHVFSNLQLLAKGNSPFRMGSNEEFAAALMGKNAAHEVFLKAPHPCLNGKGQIVDRWGTPLFFHVREASRIDIRSAGPDREMWTADDLHRCYDGQWIRGSTLPEDAKPAGR